jgi:CRISPR-associated protein Cmr4
LFFPVYTRLGTKWITSKQILNDLEPDICKSISEPEDKGEDSVFCNLETGTSLNLGWLNFKVSKRDIDFFDKIGADDFKDNFKEVIDFIKDKIVIVSDSVISQIVNSNLEVRTSVSIDPITGAAKDKALFTSEAIPRGTVFYGNVRIQNPFGENGNISEANIIEALEDSKKYFEVMGIGGMTTRGFGRIKLSSLTKGK